MAPSPHTWDPERYLAHADERGRPFLELLARIDAHDVATAVDLGCGPGTLTRLLSERWPGARVLGLDSSPEMIARARADSETAGGTAGDAVGEGGPGFAVVDLRDWRPAEPVDVLVSNAVLQWVPGHLDLLPRLVAAVRPGGWLAFQVPGNFGEPSHALRRELADAEPYAPFTREVADPASHDPATYLEALTDLGCAVDAWETTYLHVLHGEDPVFSWVSGTGARPTLEALPPDLREAFEAEFKARLAAAYPARPHGVVLPFRRIFVVARTPEAPGVMTPEAPGGVTPEAADGGTPGR